MQDATYHHFPHQPYHQTRTKRIFCPLHKEFVTKDLSSYYREELSASRISPGIKKRAVKRHLYHQNIGTERQTGVIKALKFCHHILFMKLSRLWMKHTKCEYDEFMLI